MCGLVGVIGNITKDTRLVFNQLLYADTFRGFDSTGVIQIDNSGDYSMFKRACPAPDFLDMGRAKSVITKVGHALLGHNRAATVGGVVHDNAHPFEMPNLVGMHNGTLRVRNQLDRHNDFKVDSENLLWHIDQFGLQDAVDKCTGAYALVWYDLETQKVNFYRNNERPLSLTFSDDGKHMFYASEAKMLGWILHRNKIKHTKIVDLDVHTHMTVEWEGYNKELKVETTDVIPVPPPLPKVKKKGAVVDATGRFPRPADDVYDRHEWVDFTLHDSYKEQWSKLMWYTGIIHDAENTSMKISDTSDTIHLGNYIHRNIKLRALVLYTAANGTVVVDPLSVVEVVEKEDTEYKGYNGDVLTKEEYRAILDSGCSWCAWPAQLDEKVYMIASKEYICGHCAHTDEVQEYMKEIN